MPPAGLPGAALAAAAIWLAIAVDAGTAGGVVALIFAGIMAATAIGGSARCTCCPVTLQTPEAGLSHAR
jgi:hypothetical protein